ncbi:unnamed protein product, partial [Mesorhabditis spiculigera]
MRFTMSLSPKLSRAFHSRNFLQHQPWLLPNKSKWRRKALLGLIIFFGLFTWARLQLNVNNFQLLNSYNDAPLSMPVKANDGMMEYSIAIITDLDTESAVIEGKYWRSWLKKGTLRFDAANLRCSLKWGLQDRDIELKATLANGGRAMELSDLAVFNRKLLTIDDRTGVVYQIVGNEVIPFALLLNGPGNVTAPLKGEWMTVKDGMLHVGGLGKEWTSPTGQVLNDYPMWVKTIDLDGKVTHQNWAPIYRQMKAYLGYPEEGYLIHEAVQWSTIHRKWFFLPRRASNLPYDETADESRGANIMFTMNEDFTNIQMIRVGKEATYRGFSAFQFVPGTDDNIIIAVKSEERDARPVGSYITVFDIHGNILLEEESIEGPYKYEGIAFV